MKRKLSTAASRHRNIERATKLLHSLGNLPELNQKYHWYQNPVQTLERIHAYREHVERLEAQFAAQMAELAAFVNENWTEEEIASLPDVR